MLACYGADLYGKADSAIMPCFNHRLLAHSYHIPSDLSFCRYHTILAGRQPRGRAASSAALNLLNGLMFGLRPGPKPQKPGNLNRPWPTCAKSPLTQPVAIPGNLTCVSSLVLMRSAAGM